MSVDQASEVLLEIIVEEIARVLRLPPKEIDRHRALAEIGMDSLMMLELRTTVEEVAAGRPAHHVAGQRHYTE